MAILLSTDGEVTIRRFKKRWPEIILTINLDEPMRVVKPSNYDIILIDKNKINYFKPFETVTQDNLFETDLKSACYDSLSQIIVGYTAKSV